METSVPNEAKPAPERINPSKRARQLFGELFAAKNPKARAKAMQEFAALAPGEQTFIQCELLYLNLLSQERVVTGLQDLSDQLDDETALVVETLDRLSTPGGDSLEGLFDDHDEQADEDDNEDVDNEDVDSDDEEQDDDDDDEDEDDDSGDSDGDDDAPSEPDAAA